MRFRIKAWARFLAIGASTILLFSGCSSPAPQLNLPAKNIELWVNPLDQFVPKNMIASSYAELLLNSKCMRAAGYDWNPPWRDVDARWGPSWNEAQRRLFTVALAKKYGYHEAPAPFQTPNPEWDDFLASDTERNAPGEQEALKSCLEKSRTHLKDPGQIINLAMSHIDTARDEMKAHPTVTTAAQEWQKCMQPFGVYDLPDTPESMPTRAIMAEFGVSNTPGDGARAGNSASAKELTLATADAQCRVSSGYEQASYDAEWDASVRLYRENADELERARTALKAYDEQVQIVLSENTPSK